MISEYAIDPDCAKSVDDLFRVLAGIGSEHGRLVAEFPGGWAKKVLERAKIAKVGQLQQRALARRLDIIRHAVIDMAHPYDASSGWVGNASACTPRFRAIVSPDPRDSADIIKLGTDLELEERWAVPRERVVERKTAQLLNVLEPLVRHARELVLVDPNFSPDTAKWHKPLVGLLRATNIKRLTRCEFHLRERGTEAHFRESLEMKLGPELPDGSSIFFFRWKQKQGGEALHPRYVLTEFGGIRVDFGLDEGDRGEVTDVGLLDKPVWQRRRADFSLGATTFDPAGPPIRVSKSGSRVVVETTENVRV